MGDIPVAALIGGAPGATLGTNAAGVTQWSSAGAGPVPAPVVGGATYIATPGDTLIECDSSNDTQPTVKFEAAPTTGQKHTVAWKNWDASDGSLGAHAPLVERQRQADRGVQRHAGPGHIRRDHGPEHARGIRLVDLRRHALGEVRMSPRKRALVDSEVRS